MFTEAQLKKAVETDSITMHEVLGEFSGFVAMGDYTNALESMMKLISLAQIVGEVVAQQVIIGSIPGLAEAMALVEANGGDLNAPIEPKFPEPKYPAPGLYL